MHKVLFGGIIGGVVAFVWMFVSWTLLPWHHDAVESFKNEEQVAKVIDANTSKSGVYVIPQMPGVDEVSKEVKDSHVAAMQKGPFIFMQVKKEGKDPTSFTTFLIAFATLFVGASLLSYLLMQMRGTGYFNRLFCSLLFGLSVGVLGIVPEWNWFALGGAYTLVMIGDHVVTWLLAGVVLAGFIKPKTHKQAD